jgi:hypothetical protein
MVIASQRGDDANCIIGGTVNELGAQYVVVFIPAPQSPKARNETSNSAAGTTIN